MAVAAAAAEPVAVAAAVIEPARLGLHDMGRCGVMGQREALFLLSELQSPVPHIVHNQLGSGSSTDLGRMSLDTKVSAGLQC